MKSRVILHQLFITMLFAGAATLQSCNAPQTVETTGTVSASTGTTTVTQAFASGTKAVKIVTSNNTLTGSFTLPSTVPAVTPIPTAYPGYTGTATYQPGVSASRYYDVDGTTAVSKPGWLVDVQMGVTSVSAGASCAKFGDSGLPQDVSEFYRVSEWDCNVIPSTIPNGNGSGADKVFARIVLNRDNTYLGSAENLLVQVEYQASGLHLNSDGIAADVEDNLDQLWKVYWSSTLAGTTGAKPFSVFIPPNYAACLQSGTGNGSGAGSCGVASYRGSPIHVKQIIIPLSALPTLSVIQLSRTKSRNDTAPGHTYVDTFCDTNSPLCLGVVIRSITLMRM